MWQSVKKEQFHNTFAPGAKGFMVVEVMIALVLAGLLIISVMAVLSATRKLQTDSRYRQQALGYAREAVEIINDIQHTEFAKAGSTACTPMPGYSTCWTDAYGDATKELKLVNTGSTWELQELAGSNCFQISSSPDLYRTIRVANIGTDRPNDIKQVTVDVYWPTCEASKKVTLSTILTAWKNL